MGWNAGYRIFESTVVGAYDLGLLDKDLLAVLMEPYRDTDIDSGGSEDLRAADGMGVEEIVVSVSGMDLPERPGGFTEEFQQAWDVYDGEVYAKFRKVAERFGW